MECFSAVYPTVCFLCLWCRKRIENIIPNTGIYFLLTIQAAYSVLQKTRETSSKSKGNQQLLMLSYIFITFVLATIGFAGNAKYTQMIWVDLRNAPGGPALLIDLELNYWINRLALAW